MCVIFCLPNTTHNYIISDLDYNIMDRLDCGPIKLFIIFSTQIIRLFSQ